MFRLVWMNPMNLNIRFNYNRIIVIFCKFQHTLLSNSWINHTHLLRFSCVTYFYFARYHIHTTLSHKKYKKNRAYTPLCIQAALYKLVDIRSIFCMEWKLSQQVYFKQKLARKLVCMLLSFQYKYNLMYIQLKTGLLAKLIWCNKHGLCQKMLKWCLLVLILTSVNVLLFIRSVSTYGNANNANKIYSIELS